MKELNILETEPHSYPGTLINLEGIDGSGKSTVQKKLQMRYDDALHTSEPQENQWIGKILRKALSNNELDDMALFFLFLSEHAQHLEDYVNPALEEGNLVISDRFIDSRYAYQTYAIDDMVDGDTLRWIKTIQEYGGWSTQPDKTIILDIPVDVSLDRIKNNKKEVFEKRDRLEEARDIYLQLANDNPSRYVIIDATMNPEEVFNECVSVIDAAIES